MKTLVLMRHGKAVRPEEGANDFDRPLSQAGARSLEAQLEDMLGLLPPNATEAAVLASPSARTWQTAAILCKALKARGTKVKGGAISCDSLWAQDVESFLAEFMACSRQVVFAVGHNPFIEDVARKLTGASLPCSPGALACISVDETALASASVNAAEQEGYAGRLFWFSQGPVSKRWKTLVDLEDVLKGGAQEVLARREAFLENPEDPETLHKLRVSIRTLRSLVSFIRPWQDPKQNAKLQDALKQTVAFTSRQRELDVFCDQAKQSTANSDGLVSFCEGEANKNRSRVLKDLSSKRTVRVLNEVAGTVQHIVWKASVEKCGLPASEVRAHFDSMVASLESELEHLPLSDAELTHDVRKRAKRARYAAERFVGILGADAPAVAKGMTRHQDNLGAVCDARVNIAMIDEFVSRDLDQAVAWDLSLLKAQNETFLYSALRANAIQEHPAG